MRKLFTLRCLLLAFVLSVTGIQVSAQVTHVVISQVYGGGGNGSAIYVNDFVELYNPTGSTVSLTGWSIQYASATGTAYTATPLSGSIAAGGYYLVKLASGGAVGAALPAADATGTLNLSATSGKVALSSANVAYTVACPTASLVDLVGFGSPNCSETAATAAPSNTTAVFRKSNGCTDTDNNSADFSVASPSPRNSATAPNFCVNPATVLGAAAVYTTNSATTGGNVTSEGGSPVTAKGTVWNTVAAPTVALATKTNDGTGLGIFSSTLSPLTANTKYFYRAYATNSVTTSYSAESSFTTFPNAPVVGTGSNPLVNGFTAAWTAPAGGTEAYTYTLEVDNDNGFGSLNFVQSNISSAATSFAVSGLVASTTYYYRVKAVNVSGSSVYSATSAPIQTAAPATPVITVSTALAGFGNICLNTTSAANFFTISASDLDGSNISIAALPGFVFSETAGGVYTGTVSFSTAANFTGKQIFVKFSPVLAQSYDGNISLSGGGVANISIPVTGAGINTPATVSTVNNTVSGTSATITGNISVTGCSAITAYGFEYSINNGFANGSGTQVTASNLNAGSFSTVISGLSGNVTYYVKAFATNSGGTVYGAQQSFTTSSIVPVIMSAQPLLRYTESFTDIATWTAGFTTGNGASRFGFVPANASGSIPDGVKTTVSSASFTTGTSGGVQKGTANIQMLATGSTDNSSAVAFDFYMDFTGVNAGTLSFDWASVNNQSGDRKGSLRVYASVNGTTFTQLTAADVLNITNFVPSSGSVNSIALPAIFNNSATARLRFYYSNGTGGTTGSRPKISIDNLAVSAVPSIPCVTPSAAPTSLTFANIAETSVQGSFLAASPAVNEYLVIMSTASSLTSLPLDGVTYSIGDNVGDGTVIAKGTDLNFTATGLTGSTIYYFFVFPVNSVCTNGPKYLTTTILQDDVTTAAGLPVCAAPAAQPSALVTVSSINSIQGSFAAVAADEYLVLQSTSAVLSANPVNGVVYNAGMTLGNATVIQRNGNTNFTASGLNPATTYYYTVFSINSQACLNGPAYNTLQPLSGTETTQPLPVCVTPLAQPGSLSLNASNNRITATFNASGAGYNYLVVMSTLASLSSLPTDNIDYTAGNSLGGGTVISNNTSTSFVASNLNTTTTYYFFVFASNNNCTGGTKYLLASPLTGNATTTNAPVNNYYFGNLHAHSDYSDGNKDNPGFTPANDYAYAKQSQGMDFLGISEHNHFSSLDNPGNELANYHLGVAQAAAFNAANPGFLALYGMEWGVISGGGHVVVYGDGLSELFGWEFNVNGKQGPNYDIYVPKSTYIGSEGLFKTVNDFAAKNTFATLAHPNNTDFNNLSNIAYDPVADDAISGTAVESGPSTSTNTTYSNPGSSMFYLWYYQKLLSKGYHLGPTIDHDNHNTTFGRTTAARTAVIAPALTQSDIIKAVKDMHFYATEDIDAKVDFTINNRIMGSIFEDRNAPTISVNLSDATTNTSNALIRVMAGIPGSGSFPVVVDSVFGSSLTYVDNSLANHATGYYYIDITNAGSRIVTSPIWYTRTCASATDTVATACDSFTWYGTVFTSSAVASKTFTTTGGCDSTVTLHLTINTSPLSGTVSLVGPDSGCPGTGVALTAAANGGNGAISSYQWFNNGNTVATTATSSFAAMQTGNYTVKLTNEHNCFVMAGNSVSVTVSDAVAPVLAGVPEAVTVSCDQVPPAATVTASDNCDNAPVITLQEQSTQNPDIQSAAHYQYTITRTWTATDVNGNSSSASQLITVSDTKAPVITVPENILTHTDAGLCSAAVSFAATVSDECSPVTIVYNLAPGSAFATGTTTVTVSATDVSGNTATASFTVTVTDAEKPAITAPGEYSVPSDPGKCGATLLNIGSPVVHDNCGVASVTNNHPSNDYPVGTTIVTWTVTDIHGNVTDTAKQSITVIDNEAPVISANNFSAFAEPGICGAHIELGTPAVTDNCGVATISNNHPDTYFPVGETSVTWTATDVNGNTTTAIVTITVTDAEKPTITAPGEYSVPSDPGKCGATLLNIGSPVVHDNCGVASVTNNHPSNDYPVGTTIVTWTVTDIHGNVTDTAKQSITVIDNEAPVISANDYTIFAEPGICGAHIELGVPGVTDNCGVATISNNHPDTYFPVGETSVTWTATDVNGLSSSVTVLVKVKDGEAPVITTVANQVFCTSANNQYTIPALTATDNCGASSVSYIVSGAGNRAGNTNDASGVFNPGVSTITWTVTDAAGNQSVSTTTVTIHTIPSATITVSNADAFCNKLTLTATAVPGAVYAWALGNLPMGNTQLMTLGQTNADGLYTVTITQNGCTSAAATYQFQKQNLLSSYTILATKQVSLGENNKVNSGSIGVTALNGEVELKKNSSVSAPGSFVKAKNIDKSGSNIVISNPVYAPATGITLPTLFQNNASTNNLPNKEVLQNSNTTLSGNYKNLTLKKGSSTILTGNTYGTIRVEQGARVSFTATTLNIGKLEVVKGPRNGYSYVRFAPDTKVLISESVKIGSQVYINPDNNKVTFYLGDKKSEDAEFAIKGGDTKVTANIYAPKGKLKVTGGYSYGDYGNGKGDCDKDDDEDRYYGIGNSYVYMTGQFIVEEVDGEGKNVIWNSFDCGASPVPLINATSVNQVLVTEEKTITSTEEELKVTVMPNPSTTFFTLKLESRYQTPVSLRVMDASGRVVDARSKLSSNSTLQIGHHYSNGVYYAEMIQGTQRKLVQLVKQKN